MKAHPLELSLLAGLATLQALWVLLVALLALVLTLAGYWPRQRPVTTPAALRHRRPAPAQAKPARAASHPRQSAPAGLEALTVRQLRELARQAGHRALARSGRRADLLQALAA